MPVSVTECVCGFTGKDRFVTAHKPTCQQWKDYLKMISEDPKVKAQIQAQGYKQVAKEYGISDYTLRMIMGDPSPSQKKKVNKELPSSEVTVELTPEQIIQALHTMIHNDMQIREELFIKKSQLEDVTKERDMLKSENRRLSEAKLEPIKFRLEREQIENLGKRY